MFMPVPKKRPARHQLGGEPLLPDSGVLRVPNCLSSSRCELSLHIFEHGEVVHDVKRKKGGCPRPTDADPAAADSDPAAADARATCCAESALRRYTLPGRRGRT
eukprot:385718_1